MINCNKKIYGKEVVMFLMQGDDKNVTASFLLNLRKHRGKWIGKGKLS